MKKNVLPISILPICLVLVSCGSCDSGSGSFDPAESPLSFSWDEKEEGYWVKGSSATIKGDISIPSLYEGKPVIGIDSNAFRLCEGITSIRIPSSVRHIGPGAFDYRPEGKQLYFEIESMQKWLSVSGKQHLNRNVHLLSPNGEEIKEAAIPFGVTEINDYEFASCSFLTSIDIPNSVLSIGSYAFEWCASLTSISVPESVLDIGWNAFPGSEPLDKLYHLYHNAYYLGNDENPYLWLVCRKNENISSCLAHERCRHIYSDAFASCRDLTEVTFGRSVESIGDRAFSSCTALEHVTIPSSVNSIGYEAFAHCVSLVDLSLESGVKEIGGGMLLGCKSLSSLFLPASIESVGDSAFAGCMSLGEIRVDETNPSFASREGVLYDKDIEDLIHYPQAKTGVFAVPDSLAHIPSNAFDEVAWGYSFSVSPNNLHFSSFGGVLYDNEATRLIRFPYRAFGEYEFLASIESIAYHAFFRNELPSLLRLTQNLVEIEEMAFASSTGMERLILGKKVTKIGKLAFGAAGVSKLFYEGSQAEFETASRKWEPGCGLGRATTFYYSETKPLTPGSYWHYVNGEPTLWNE